METPVLQQVSLAVLLDNFVAASARLEAKEVAMLVMEQKALRQFRNPLEPLIIRSAFSLSKLGSSDNEKWLSFVPAHND
jgi:hypothetical protein